MNNYQSEKKLILKYYSELDGAVGDDHYQIMDKYTATNYLWRGFYPFNEKHSTQELVSDFWIPFKNAITRNQRRMDIFMAGHNSLEAGGVWVVSMGHIMGLFDKPWLGILPTGKMAFLRYCEFNRIENNKISETAMYFDIPHLMTQVGMNPFPTQTAAHLVQPGPLNHDGLMFDNQDETETKKTLEAINYMVQDIKGWTGGKEEPLVQELARSWNDDMIWWGPAGIGATYTIERYAKQHSGPFREGLDKRIFNGHICRMSEGSFGGFFGWPNLTLRPTGGFMGMPASEKSAEMRVIDIYSRQGDKLTENWIFIDLLHFWNQLGVDLLKRAVSHSVSID
jgi:predicted ester cyclase|tara:strand:- start:1831 stop:2844 length:1014 start_codon:yes stop_codon:yes gene_type:complete